MKSIFIVIALCGLFIITSGFSPAGIRPYFSISPPTGAALAPADAGNVRIIEKTKAGKLPRWHRVIPGMFR
jgi:hypothetical protein